MSDPEPKLATTRMGSYTIVRKLARGGMAELFLARSLGSAGTERLVVLKTILPRYAENPRYVQLFLDEAKLAASLDHPHIVPVYDVGRIDKHHFFTMEYVHGQDLRSVLRRTDRNRKTTPIALAAQIARAVASALHHAHERKRPDGTLHNIVHRDVSPSNILLSYEGAIKLADFGVAKAASSSTRTRTGTLKGKVGYMSPEQARGAPIDRRSDVFSLGVVLWELLTVRRLFKTDNDLATIQAIIHHATPSIVDLRPDCPPELERIAYKALEKDPAARYQTAEEMQRDLEALARDAELDPPPTTLGVHLAELFEGEITAWREAQASGVTVTDFVVSTEPRTPISESELSLEGGSFAEIEPGEADDLDEVDEESDPGEIADQATMPPQAPLAGAIINSDPLEEATAIAPPPIMFAEKIQVEAFEASSAPKTQTQTEPFEMVTTVDPKEFEAAPTALSAPAFRDELPTVQGHRFGDEAATIPAPRASDGGPARSHDTITTVLGQPVQTPPAGMPVAPSVLVSPQTPPTGIPSMHPYPVSGSHPSMPAWDPNHQSLTPQPSLHISGLTPQRRLVIFSIVTVTLIVIVVVIAILAGDSPPSE